jgi:predicted dienelactone hydrolase
VVCAVGGCQGPGVVYDPFGPGPHAVQVRTLQLTDGVRPAPCELWLPEGRDALPLVVFSHLSGGTRLSSAFLCRHLAGHGYAVAALDHTDVVARRVPEVRLVLTELLAGTGGLRLDGSRVGVVGHSFGGWTVLATPDQEPRVRAVVALAPGGAGRPRPGIIAVGLDFAWGRDVPTLYLAGGEDVMTPLDGITELYRRTPARARMFVLRGADHLHFVDDVEAAHESLRLGTLPGDAAWIPAAMRPLVELCPPARAHEAIRGLTLAHLDATLRDDRRAEAFLRHAGANGIPPLGVRTPAG